MTAPGTIYEDCKRQLCGEVGNRGDLWKYSAPGEDIDAYSGETVAEAETNPRFRGSLSGDRILSTHVTLVTSLHCSLILNLSVLRARECLQQFIAAPIRQGRLYQ